jgi:hypothetical protein
MLFLFYCTVFKKIHKHFAFLISTVVRTRNVFALLQHLNNLLENYLEPLKKETFLSNAEINALFGNIQEIVAFQRQFLQNLDEALELEPDFHKFEHPSQFKVSILSIIDS